MARKTVTARAEKVIDIREKTQYYIVLTAESGEKYVINVGEKTYNACMKMEGITETTEHKPSEQRSPTRAN